MIPVRKDHPLYKHFLEDALCEAEEEYNSLKGYKVGLFSNPDALRYHQEALHSAYKKLEKLKKKLNSN